MTTRTRLALAAALAALLVSCDTTEPPAPTPSQTVTTSPADQADAYARQHSGGETTGCSQAAPGPEAEQHPGCIYSVAFAGCLHGITGEQAAPLPIESEFPDEPALVDLYHQARQECGGS